MSSSHEIRDSFQVKLQWASNLDSLIPKSSALSGNCEKQSGRASNLLCFFHAISPPDTAFREELDQPPACLLLFVSHGHPQICLELCPVSRGRLETLGASLIPLQDCTSPPLVQCSPLGGSQDQGGGPASTGRERPIERDRTYLHLGLIYHSPPPALPLLESPLRYHVIQVEPLARCVTSYTSRNPDL